MKTIFTALVCALLLTACVPQNLENPKPEAPKEVQSFELAPEYLAAGKWGEEDSALGSHIVFNEDGTFVASFAGESDGITFSGPFTIEGNEITLKTELYSDLSLEEAQKTWSYLTPKADDHLTFGKTQDSFFSTDYLAQEGRIVYWNQNAEIPEGSARRYENYLLLTTRPEWELKTDAALKPIPRANPNAYTYSFDDGMGGPQPFSDFYRGVAARSQFKETVNGVEDYWYLVRVDLGWYTLARLGDTPTDVSLGWLHGSELEQL